MNGPIGALAVRGEFGREVAAVLWSTTPIGPVIAVPCQTMVLWVFLTTSDGGAFGPVIPRGARLLSRRQYVPLPPSHMPGGEVRRISWPRPADLCLPKLTTLLAAVRSTRRPSGR